MRIARANMYADDELADRATLSTQFPGKEKSAVTALCVEIDLLIHFLAVK